MERTLINLSFFMPSLDTKDDFSVTRHKIGQFLTKSQFHLSGLLCFLTRNFLISSIRYPDNGRICGLDNGWINLILSSFFVFTLILISLVPNTFAQENLICDQFLYQRLFKAKIAPTLLLCVRRLPLLAKLKKYAEEYFIYMEKIQISNERMITLMQQFGTQFLQKNQQT